MKTVALIFLGIIVWFVIQAIWMRFRPFSSLNPEKPSHMREIERRMNKGPKYKAPEKLKVKIKNMTDHRDN